MHCSRIMDCLTMHVQFQSSYLHFSTQSLKKHLLILLRLQPKQSKRVSLPNLLITIKTHYKFSFETRSYNFLSHSDRLLFRRSLNNEASLHCCYRSSTLSSFNGLYPLPGESLYCSIALYKHQRRSSRITAGPVTRSPDGSHVSTCFLLADRM